jgi:hypothetical protein
MRNLSIISSSRWFFDGNDLPTAIAFDLDEGATYVGCEESRDDSRFSKAPVVHIQKIEPDAEPVSSPNAKITHFLTSARPDNHWIIHPK